MSAHSLESPRTPVFAWTCALPCGAMDLGRLEARWRAAVSGGEGGARHGSSLGSPQIRRDPPYLYGSGWLFHPGKLKPLGHQRNRRQRGQVPDGYSIRGS